MKEWITGSSVEVWMFIKTLSANVPLEGAWMLGGKKKIMSKKKQTKNNSNGGKGGKGFNTLYCFICLISLWTHHRTEIIRIHWADLVGEQAEKGADVERGRKLGQVVLGRSDVSEISYLIRPSEEISISWKIRFFRPKCPENVGEMPENRWVHLYGYETMEKFCIIKSKCVLMCTEHKWIDSFSIKKSKFGAGSWSGEQRMVFDVNKRWNFLKKISKKC